MDPEACPHLWLRLRALLLPEARQEALHLREAHREALLRWAVHRQEAHREVLHLWAVRPLEEHHLWAGPQRSRLDPKARDPR